MLENSPLLRVFQTSKDALLQPLPPPPFPGHYKFTLPQSALGSLCLIFIWNIVIGISPVRDGPTRPSHCRIEINWTCKADGYNTLVPIHIFLMTSHPVLSNKSGQFKLGHRTARVDGATLFLTGLFGFRRINAVEADTNLIDFDCVAIGDDWLSDKLLCR